MRYLEVSIRCRRGSMEAVANLLTDVTGSGYAVDDPLDIITNQQSGSWDASDLVPGDPEWVTLKAWLAEAGDLEQARLRLEQGLAEIRKLGLGEIQPATYAWVQEEDWANNWKAYFKPLRVGQRLVVIPSWETYDLQKGDVPIRLDPGMAFGTGTHATTALCLRQLERLVTPGARVLDVGTGSGILAIAARLLGAGHVTAIDTDPVAIQVARENAAKNGVELTISHGTIDQLPQEPYDLIVANIIASVIVDILPEVASRMAQGAKFLASGIIAERKQEVLDAMLATWLLPLEAREENGWVAILAGKA